MAEVLVRATRSFSGIMKDELHTVDAEVEKWAHFIHLGYLEVVAEVAAHGDEVADVAKDAAIVDPGIAPEADAAAEVIETAATDARAITAEGAKK